MPVVILIIIMSEISNNDDDNNDEYDNEKIERYQQLVKANLPILYAWCGGGARG